MKLNHNYDIFFRDENPHQISGKLANNFTQTQIEW